MPIPISALAADLRTVTCDVAGNTLTMTYRPSAINAKQEARELEERAAGRHVQSMANSLAEMIESWDVVDDKGKPVAVSQEVLSTFGWGVLRSLTRAITDDLLPNRPPAVNSNGTSSPTADSAPAQTGT